MQSPLHNLSRYDIRLASKSPRRRELLGMLGLQFSIAETIDVYESYPHDLPTNEVAPYIAKKKGDTYRKTLREGMLVITADTVVITDGEILGKPHSADEAVEMLRKLSGHSHTVMTGVTLATTERTRTFAVETTVEFARLSDEEIRYYVDRYSPLDKAGAYGIQEWIGAIGVKSISGSYYNVMGLPLHRLYNELREF